MVPARPLAGMVPVRRPAVIGGIDVGRQPLLEAVQLVRPAEVHLAGQDRAIAAKPQTMGEGRNVGGEFRGVVIDAGARRQAAGHEGGARGRAEGARAIGAVEHDAGIGEREHVRRAGQSLAIDRQERRRHLVGHDEEDVRRSHGHRLVLAGLPAGLFAGLFAGFVPGLLAALPCVSDARVRAHSFSIAGTSFGS